MKGGKLKPIPITTEERDIPSLDGEEKIATETVSKKGAVKFTEWRFKISEGEESPRIDPTGRRVIFDWQKMLELQEDHGFSTMYRVLHSDEARKIFKRPSQDLATEIREKIGPDAWVYVERNWTDLCDGNDVDGRGHVFLVAGWAELFAEKFGDIWLAAMAQHAIYVQEDEFAFGYLTALLDQKVTNESNMIRGAATLTAARSGGDVRRIDLTSFREVVLSEMERLISNGHTVSGAASAAKRLGIGTSQGANLALWYRHRRKL